MIDVIFSSVPYIKLKLHRVKLKKLDVFDWRVFVDQSHMYLHCTCVL